MLTLIEDENTINKHFENYLEETDVLEWKYEHAVKLLLDQGFHSNNETDDLKKLGSMYKSVMTKLSSRNSNLYSEAEHKKIASILENMEFLATAAPIKKILRETKWKNKYQQSLENEVVNATATQEESWEDKKRAAEKNFEKLSATEKFTHLATFYGEDGVLDLQKAELPRRFSKHLHEMKQEVGISIQPLVTLEERDMIIEISKSKSQSEVKTLLSTWYSKKGLSSNCKYIRFALAASFEIWSTNSLLNKKHGEDWYRMHVYSNVWDKAFLDDNEFETKRSECVSQVMKVLKETEKDIKLQRLDFILRDLNTDNDIVTVEEKPSLKGVKADIKKGHSLKKHALYLWSKQVKSDVLMEQLEAISCQWQGTKFTIYGSRLLSSGKILTYKKGVFSFPNSIKHLPEFSKLLLAIISLKRIVKLNYAKFILILEEKYKQEIERLNFSEDSLNEISFVSNSANSDCESEEEGNQDDKDDGDFVERTKEKLDQMKPDEQGLKKFSDWEDLLLFDCTKRRRTKK